LLHDARATIAAAAQIKNLFILFGIIGFYDLLD
jgi:hypothetical protein